MMIAAYFFARGMFSAPRLLPTSVLAAIDTPYPMPKQVKQRLYIITYAPKWLLPKYPAIKIKN
jgi:hypothetical protein